MGLRPLFDGRDMAEAVCRRNLERVKREIQKVIDAIVDGVKGDDSRSGEPRLRIELRGNLAAMLAAAHKTKRSPTGDLLVPVEMVAGACNQRYLQSALPGTLALLDRDDDRRRADRNDSALVAGLAVVAC